LPFPGLALARNGVPSGRNHALAGRLFAPLATRPDEIRQQAVPLKLDKARLNTGGLASPVAVPAVEDHALVELDR